jgi:RNA polymerase sigma factor (sigma-70 family)
MRQSDSEKWDLTRWKQAMDARGSAEEEEAYRRLSRYLIPVAYKFLHSCSTLLIRESSISIEKLAEDYVQETLLKVYEYYSQFRWQSHIQTYATTILHRSILASLRSGRVNREIPVEIREPEGEEDENPIQFIMQNQMAREDLSPEEQLILKEKDMVLIFALNELSELQRRALLMVTVDEIPVFKLAAELGISVDALYKNISRARQHILKALQASSKA